MRWMTFMKWGCGTSISIAIFLCVCLSLMVVRGPGDQITNTFTIGDDYDPSGATCDNANVAYSDNPFSGWPAARGWGDINYFYCAADYYAEFGRTHWGVDIETYRGEPVFATASATVAWAYYDTVYGMGRTVKLCTPAGWCAIYMHLDGFAVIAGQQVQRGEVVGYADNTGFSTGDHLHYQINNPAGQPVDPGPTFGG
jgi:murein DD-endopeptidase MepM/ murein hydrolase activator NlpD